MTAPIFRRIDPDEVVAYRELVQAAYRADQQPGVHFEAATAPVERFTLHLTQDVAWGYEEDGELVATASVRFPWAPDPGPYGLPHLSWVATAPQRARQGWSHRVIGAVEALLRDDLHCPALSLGTAQNHPWLAGFYTGLGYRPAGEADLGLGHITEYFVKPLDPTAFSRWLDQHPNLIKEHA